MRRLFVGLCSLMCLVNACGSGDDGSVPGNSTAEPTTGVETSTDRDLGRGQRPVTSAPSQPEPALRAEQEIQLRSLGTGANRWTTMFSIPYGSEVEQLGQAAIGEDAYWTAADGCTVDPHGNLWIAEAAKQRFVEFAPSGEFVREIPIPVQHLVDGRYFPYHELVATATGTLVTMRDTETGVSILLYESGEFEEISLDGYWEFMGSATDSVFFAAHPDSTVGVFTVSNRTFTSGELAADTRGYSQVVDGERLLVTQHPSGTQTPIRFMGRDDRSLYWGAQSQPGVDGDLWLEVRAAIEGGDDLGGIVHLEPGQGALTVDPLPFDNGDEKLRSTTSLFINPRTGRPAICVARDTALEVEVLNS